MNRPAQLFRIMHINFVMARYGLDQFILATPIFYPIRFLGYFNPWYWINRRSGRKRGECLRLALIALGPVYVKFGQILSTRRDFIPDDIAEELAKLQDQVPPFPGEVAKKIIEASFGKPIDELFLEFDMQPLASASIAQVHAATLFDGRKVVVKVLRPNIEKVIRNDINLFYTIARLLERYWSHGPRLRPVEIVAEFERTIIDELDLLREAANASQLRRNFLYSPLLHIPEVYWEYAHTDAVVFERIKGIPVADVATLREKNVDLKKLAERGVEIFFTQVLRDSFFHADMHPGNIFVDAKDPSNPQYIAVDFGIMGSLSPNDQRYLAENFLAFFKRDYRQVALLHVESGWVPPDTRVEEFEATIRAVCEPIFGRPLKDISFGQLLLRLFQAARRFHMEVQPQLMLLQKTLLNIEGLGRQLYPELDLWTTAQPFLERWIKRQVGLRSLLRRMKQQAPYWTERLADMPEFFYKALRNMQAPMAYPITTTTTRVVETKPLVRRPNFARVIALSVGLTLLIIGILTDVFLSNHMHTMDTQDYVFLTSGLIVLLIGLILPRHRD